MLRRLWLSAAAALVATPAFAHLPAGEYGSFAAGFTHPIFGPDHILAMVMVGLWASTVGGRALWAVPAAFVATMAAGFALAHAGVELPLVEPMILASVVVLGLLVALAVRLPGAALAAVFAVFHGYAHGTESTGAAAVEFGLGFALATALLHAAGIALGLAIGSGFGRTAGARASRFVGAAAAAFGVVLIFA